MQTDPLPLKTLDPQHKKLGQKQRRLQEDKLQSKLRNLTSAARPAPKQATRRLLPAPAHPAPQLPRRPLINLPIRPNPLPPEIQAQDQQLATNLNKPDIETGPGHALAGQERDEAGRVHCLARGRGRICDGALVGAGCRGALGQL